MQMQCWMLRRRLFHSPGTARGEFQWARPTNPGRKPTICCFDDNKKRCRLWVPSWYAAVRVIFGIPQQCVKQPLMEISALNFC